MNETNLLLRKGDLVKNDLVKIITCNNYNIFFDIERECFYTMLKHPKKHSPPSELNCYQTLSEAKDATVADKANK